MSISCVKCRYAITEPLCASCVVNEFKAWSFEKNINFNISRMINKKLRVLLSYVASLDHVTLPFGDSEEESMLKCIKCNRDMHLMCFYCVNNQLSLIVRENIISKNLIQSFDESFNMSLYEHELAISNSISSLNKSALEIYKPNF